MQPARQNMPAHGNLNPLDLVMRPHGVSREAIQFACIQREIALVDFIDRPLRNPIINRGDQITFPCVTSLPCCSASWARASRPAATSSKLGEISSKRFALPATIAQSPIPSKSDWGSHGGHAQQIPVQANRRDDGIQQPFLLAKPPCPTRLLHYTLRCACMTATIGVRRFRASKFSG